MCYMTVCQVQILLPGCVQGNPPRRGAAPPRPATNTVVCSNRTPRASKPRAVDGVIICPEQHLAGTFGVNYGQGVSGLARARRITRSAKSQLRPFQQRSSMHAAHVRQTAGVPRSFYAQPMQHKALNELQQALHKIPLSLAASRALMPKTVAQFSTVTVTVVLLQQERAIMLGSASG